MDSIWTVYYSDPHSDWRIWGYHSMLRGHDDNEKTVKDRLETYEVTTKPLVTYYRKQGKLKHIKAFADTSVDELVQTTLLELAKD